MLGVQHQLIQIVWQSRSGVKACVESPDKYSVQLLRIPESDWLLTTSCSFSSSFHHTAPNTNCFICVRAHTDDTSTWLKYQVWDRYWSPVCCVPIRAPPPPTQGWAIGAGGGVLILLLTPVCSEAAPVKNSKNEVGGGGWGGRGGRGGGTQLFLSPNLRHQSEGGGSLQRTPLDQDRQNYSIWVLNCQAQFSPQHSAQSILTPPPSPPSPHPHQHTHTHTALQRSDATHTHTNTHIDLRRSGPLQVDCQNNSVVIYVYKIYQYIFK